MIIRFFKKNYPFILILILFFSVNIVYADSPPPTGGDSISNPLNATSFDELINNIAYWIFNIAIPLSVLMFLIGGFMFLVSGGNEQRVTQAKKLMIWSAVGLAICLIGSGFTSMIRQLIGG